MPTETAEPTATRSRWRPVIYVIVAGLVAMWVYVIYLAFGPGRQDPPDRLADPAFATAAQERCSQALDQVAQLPRIEPDTPPDVVSDAVSEANEHFAAMLDDLAALAPSGEDGEIVMEWIGDWRTYLADREAYAEAVRDDRGAQLLVSPKANRQVTTHIDAFAQDNRMPSCGTPIDIS